MHYLTMLIHIYNMRDILVDYQVLLLFSFWDICRLFCTVAIYGYREQQTKLSLTTDMNCNQEQILLSMWFSKGK